jgi:membrane protein
MKNVLGLAKQAFREWKQRGAPRMGAALAFYSLLSLAPLVILVVGICALVFGMSGAQTQILEQFRALVGEEGARAIEVVLASAQKPATGVAAGILGLATLLFGASGVFIELRSALNELWKTPPAKTTSGVWAFVKDRFLSIGIVLAVGFLLLVSLLVSAGLGVAGKFFASFGFLPPAVWEVVNFIVSLGVISCLFVLILRFIPDVRLPWRDLWLGGTLTAVLFTLGKTAIGIYLGKAGVGSAYGAAGSLVVLVVWIYYSAQIFLYGATLTRICAEARGWHPAVSAGEHRRRETPYTPRELARIAVAALVMAALWQAVEKLRFIRGNGTRI